MQLYGSLFSAGLIVDWDVRPADLGCIAYGEGKDVACYGDHEYIVREANSSFDQLASTGAQRWSNLMPLRLKAAVQGAQNADFALYTVSGVDRQSGWAFLGAF
jgi:hypothetical protein